MTTGEVTGVPQGLPASLTGDAVFGAMGDVASGVVSGISGVASTLGDVFFKQHDGGAKEAGDPRAIQAHWAGPFTRLSRQVADEAATREFQRRSNTCVREGGPLRKI